MTMTRRHLLAGSAALAVASIGAAHARTDGRDAALDEVFAEAGVPALAGMVLGPDGPLWLGARGVRRRGGTDPVTTRHRWHLGSNTKAITAALYGRLVDRGEAEWDAMMAALTHDGSNTLWYVSAWVAPGIGRAFVAVSNDAARGGPACQALIGGLIGAS